MLAQPALLYTVAGILFTLALVPGMPHLAFISFAALVAFIAWMVARNGPPTEAASLEQVEALGKAMEQERAQNMVWEDIPLVERLSVSLGYKLVGLVNEAAGGGQAQAVRFGHPSGTLRVGAEATQVQGQWQVRKAIMSRSARVLMEGAVRVPANSVG